MSSLRHALAVVTCCLVGVAGAGCGSDASTSRSSSASTSASTAPSAAGVSGEIVVFAASSLTDAFTAIGDAFHAAHPEATVTFNFAGSGDLVTQITDGAPADVFASADESNMTKLTDAAESDGEPVVIARNQFEIIVEHGNPTGISGLADLANPDLTVVLCADTVPCGKGAAKVLSQAGVTVTPKSYEDKVKGVVTKVTTGEADAGIVFVTDVLAAGGAASGVEIPADVNTISKYPVVVTKDAPNAAAAQAFVDFASSGAGQQILATYGFLAP